MDLPTISVTGAILGRFEHIFGNIYGGLSSNCWPPGMPALHFSLMHQIPSLFHQDLALINQARDRLYGRNLTNSFVSNTVYVFFLFYGKQEQFNLFNM